VALPACPKRTRGFAAHPPGAPGIGIEHAAKNGGGQKILNRRVHLQDGTPHHVVPLAFEHPGVKRALRSVGDALKNIVDPRNLAGQARDSGFDGSRIVRGLRPFGNSTSSLCIV